MNGWKRLGIVLSICWAVVVVIFAAYEWVRFPLEPFRAYKVPLEAQVDEQAKGFYFVVAKESIGLDAMPLDERRNVERFASEDKDPKERKKWAIFLQLQSYYSSGINWPVFLAVLFLPITLGWLVIYALRLAVRWVSQGFRGEQVDPP